jgi:hypothetical protein
MPQRQADLQHCVSKACIVLRAILLNCNEVPNGTRNSALAARCATTDNFIARHVFAPLMENTMQAGPDTGGVSSLPMTSIAEPSKSAASWGAIIAGAFVAAAVSLILLALGSGLGFASISFGPNRGASLTTFAVTSAIWLIVMQWVSAAVGGYTAGRLRTRWIGTHHHEVFFRDTAHGFVTWAVATVLVAGLAANTMTSIAGGGARAASTAAAAAADNHSPSVVETWTPRTAYEADRLFRATEPTTTPPTDSRAEADRVMINGLAAGDVPEDDRAYLADLVATRTGISRADAQKRVDAFIAQAKDEAVNVKATADRAREAAAQLSIYTALSLLTGAFIASVCAALGGRIRDEHP